MSSFHEEQLAEELSQEREWILAAINSLPEEVWFLNADGKVILINDAACENLGVSRQEAEGKSAADVAAMLEVYAPDGTKRPDKLPIDRVLAGSEDRGDELVRNFKTGQLRYRRYRMAPVRCSGHIVGAVATVRDITERKRAEDALRESEERFRIMADCAPMFIWVTNADGGNRFVNRTYREYFGVSFEQVEGDGWQPFFHPDDVAAYVAAFMRSVRERTPFRAEARVRRGDGEWRWIATEAVPRFSESGEFLGHVGTSLDITERKQAEETLREADRRRSEFLAMLSHELRNPLTPVRNSVYLLDKNASLDNRGRRAVAIIDRQVSHLARLIDDLLDVMRITRGKIRLQLARLNLVEVVQRTVEDHRAVLERHHVTLQLPKEPTWIAGDATRLVQVVGNLLNNAAKFTPADGSIAVSLAKVGADAVVEIADDGMGMEALTIGQLFQPFAQADRGLDRSQGGLGLGLALVKGLVDLHGGEVRAHSDGPGRGSRFTVTLPLEQRATPEEQATASRDEKAERSVLIIEDNLDAAESLGQVLGLAGHHVAIAFNGAEGVAKAHELAPDIVLCDIGLPGGMDGYAVARALRHGAEQSSAFLVALTGYAQPEDQRRALEAGFDAHLAKPPDLEALNQMIARAPVHQPRG